MLKKLDIKYNQRGVRRDNYRFEKLEVAFGWRHAAENCIFVQFDTFQFSDAFSRKVELTSDIELR